mgnify:CR=1 FL=1
MRQSHVERQLWKIREYFKTNISKIVQTRENVKEQLRDLGFECTDSKANFLFVTHPRYDALKLFEELKEAGIYVRHWNDPKIKDYLRIHNRHR